MQLEYKDYITLSEDEACACLEGCEGFVFASGIDERVTAPAPMYNYFNRFNVLPLERLMRAAKKCAVKNTVICGSYFSHFDKKWPALELSKLYPYIRSRREQEKMALSFAGEDFNVAVLELPYIFGIQKGKKPVWTNIVKTVRGMDFVTLYPRGGTTMITRKQAAQAAAGALEKTEGGKCWPIGYYNMPWREFLPLVHTHMGLPERKVIIVPDWLPAFGLKAKKIIDSRFLKVRAKEEENKIENSGFFLPKFSGIHSADCYIDKIHGSLPLGVQDDDIEKAIGESIRYSVDVLDGKVKNAII
jgi:nucleoside-diphosphate-sugar epimerase